MSVINYLKRIQNSSYLRYYCSNTVNNDKIDSNFVNRNPRNLEKLRIAHKPDGYHLEKPGRSYWNKLHLEATGRHITASILHHTDGPVITASTKEWAIKKQLFKTTDTSAYINLARVLAQRCLYFGVTEVRCDLEGKEGGKVEAFLNTLSNEGLKLSEPVQFKPHRPWDKDRPEKPWEYEY